MNFNASTPDSRDIFDPEQALELADNDQELLEMIIQKFQKRCPELMSAIHQALDSGDWEAGQDAAHTLKGNAAYLCTHEVGRCATAMEQACKGKQADEARNQLAALEVAVTRLQAELHL